MNSSGMSWTLVNCNQNCNHWPTEAAVRAGLGRHRGRGSAGRGRLVLLMGDNRRAMRLRCAVHADGSAPTRLPHTWEPCVAVRCAGTRAGDGRVVTGQNDRQVPAWDPASPKSPPIELAAMEAVTAIAVLDDVLVITGAMDGRVLAWDLAQSGTVTIQLNCSVSAVAVTSTSGSGSRLVIAYRGDGISFWSPLD